MGQGGYLLFNNTTDYPLNRYYIHSNQLYNWKGSFQPVLAPRTSAKFYLETDDSILEAHNTTVGEANYNVGDTGEHLFFSFSRNGQDSQRCIWGSMDTKTPTHNLYTEPSGPLGWVHDGWVSLVLRKGSPVSCHNWMKKIPDSVNLAELSIPGTHESGALHEPAGGTAKTQNLSIPQQLDFGIRFLDIRCSVSENEHALLIFHGKQPFAVYQEQNFDDVLNACANFLNANPSETILMRVRNEGENKEEQFCNLFGLYEKSMVDVKTRRTDLFFPDASLPYKKFPNLGAARGRIVLLRNFGLSWPPGEPPCMSGIYYGDEDFFVIEDNYEIKIDNVIQHYDASEKWKSTTDAIQNRAHTPNNDKLSIIYTSGYFAIKIPFTDKVMPDILGVVNYVNPRLLEWAAGAQIFNWGVFPMDFVEPLTARFIYMTNRWLNE
ncbi:MAG: phosphatidylinositol-specific phospholipase C [Terracidiphilus sp.]|jgi:1-phosphatidylinositol phosphodiesterase